MIRLAFDLGCFYVFLWKEDREFFAHKVAYCLVDEVCG